MTGISKTQTTYSPVTGIDLKDFKPDHYSKIQEGQTVLHLKFGKGNVIKIDGGINKKIATIHFDDLSSPEKRIMLKFAKLQIVE